LFLDQPAEPLGQHLAFDHNGTRRRIVPEALYLPVTALVDQFYSEVQKMGGKHWDTSSLIALLQR
jgi:hypothetical protein